MALTPDSIRQISEAIEEVYSNCVDQLLLNIASHLKDGEALGTLEWEVMQLAEVGQLTRENIDIIKSFTGDVPAILDGTLGTAIMAALEEVEEDLAAAVAANILSGAVTAPLASQSVINILSYYSQQAKEQLNLVNTVMLNSSLAQYRKVISDTIAYEKQLELAQKILNTSTGEVALGMSSRTQALRRAVMQMNRAGLTGFKDAGGHNWSVEAYVNMDIRTTVHNVAVQSVFARNADYGNSLISVSSHAGARPGCYPYQGKVYSTDGTSGEVEDLHGQMLQYEPLENTSYGLPAGLFGINCGHMPSAFIPGLSVVRGEPQSKEENDKAYKLSQQQRKLEREVRYAKREAAMMNAMGDKEGFEKAAEKVKQKQGNLGRFITNTGRTARVDRTQVLEYNKSVAGKVAAANRNADKALTPLERVKKYGIDEGGKYRVLPFAKERPGEIRVFDPGVEKYKSFIMPEYRAQQFTRAERDILWSKNGGYIQNAEGYKKINDYMRGFAPLPTGSGSPNYQTTIDVMVRATTNNALQNSYIGFRKVAPDFLQTVMGIETESLCFLAGTPRAYFNSAASSKRIAEQINALVGTDRGILTDKAVTSVSLCEGINYFTSRPVKFVIQMPAGTQGLITNNWPESEFMARPETSLELLGAESCKYNDKYGIKDGIIIYARMVQK